MTDSVDRFLKEHLQGQRKWPFCETSEATWSQICDSRMFSNWGDGCSLLSDALGCSNKSTSCP